MMKATQLRELIIKPALQDLVMLSESAVELLIFTCAVESNGGSYLKQINGPALGIYQMEPEDYNDIWQNYLANNNRLLMMLSTNFEVNRMPSEDRLIYDLRFATAMARIHYERISAPLPLANDVDAIWAYYKQHYNTPSGAAVKDLSLYKYYAFIKT